MTKPEITKKTSTPTKPPDRPIDAGVEEHDQKNSDGSQPLDIGTE